jgi:hypothetical protein
MGEMERRVFRSMPLLVALFASGAGVSCGSGLHDGDEEQSTTRLLGRGEHVEFMGGRLDVCDDCLNDDTAKIRFSWRRTISPSGARSGVYTIEVPSQSSFRRDPTLTISTSREVAEDQNNVIGFLQRDNNHDWWVPDQTVARPSCDSSGPAVCGPVQAGSFKDGDTTVLQLAIVTKCGSEADCLSGESCQALACQQCVPGSPCKP